MQRRIMLFHIQNSGATLPLQARPCFKLFARYFNEHPQLFTSPVVIPSESSKGVHNDNDKSNSNANRAEAQDVRELAASIENSIKMGAHPWFSNFTAGELTELLEARTDFQKYANGAQTLKNVVVRPHGGATRRAGSFYLGEVKDSSLTTIIRRFEFSITQAYILEFGNLYIRVWADRALVRTATTSPAYAMTPGATTGFSVTFTAASATFTNTATDRGRVITYTEAGKSGVAVVKTVNSTTVAVCAVTTDFTDTGLASGEWSITGTPVEIVTPYVTADLRELRFTQSADTLYIAHRNYKPRKFTRLTATSFQLSIINFLPGPSFESPQFPAATLTLSAVSGTGITLTASAASFQAGDVGRQVVSGAGRATIKSFTSATVVTADVLDDFASVGPIAANSWQLEGSPNAGTLTPGAAGPEGKVTTFTASLAAFSAGDITEGALLYGGDGCAKVSGFTSATVVNAEILRPFTNASAIAAGLWTKQRPAWATAFGFPGTVALDAQRLWWAGSDEFPDSVWGSVVGDYENHAKGATATAAVDFPLAFPEVNLIRWLKTLSGLIAGTLAGEIALTRDDGVPLTATEPPVPRGTRIGSDHDADAVSTTNAVLFLQRGAQRIYEFALNENAVAVGSFVSADLTRLSEHLFRAGCLELAMATSPERLVFVIRTNGVLLCLTYARDEQVVAWTWHQTDGNYESVAVIPNSSETGDEVSEVVKRTIDGATKRYIEVSDGQLNTDCALTYSGVAASTFTGLGHLEAKTVKAIAADGTVSSLVVSNGQITLPGGASTTALEVGLDYTSTVETLRPELVSPTGTAQGRPKKWNYAIVRVANTKGTITLNGETLKYPEGTDETAAFKGDMQRKANMGWDREGRLTIQTTQPKPMTILGITGSIQIDDG